MHRLWYVMKSGFYVTTSSSQLSGWTKKLQSTSQSQKCTKKRSYSLFGGLLPVWSETIISEKYAQQINDMHWKLRHLQPALVNRKCPILLQDNAQPHVTQPALQKFNELGNKVLPHPPHSPDLIQLTTTSSSISTTFGRENASTTSGRQKMLSKFVEFQITDFYAIGMNTFTSCWQKCVDCTTEKCVDSYFD